MGLIFTAELQLSFETTPELRRNEFSFVHVNNTQTAPTVEEILPLFYGLISDPDNASKNEDCEEVF